MTDPPEIATNETPEEMPTTPVEGEDGDFEIGGEEESPSDAGEENNNDRESARGDGGTELKAAPQAQEMAAGAHRQESMESEGELVECKLTPVEYQNQRKNLRDALDNEVPAVTPPLESNGDHPHVQFSEEQNDVHQSALHQDEYSHYSDQNQYNPRNHESALAGSAAPNSKLGNPFEMRKKTRLKKSSGEGGRSHGRHSHPRKSPYRSEVARLRHAQQVEREKRRTAKDPPADDVSHVSNASTTASGKSISLKDTTAPPETAFFSIQSAKLKHTLLHSLGEFLTSAFADDEESSGSYFSQDLLDQLASSNPHLKGVWLQAKSLNDDHVRQLCEALIRNKVVTEVWLPSNNITDVGAGHIAHMLKFNKSIKELFLGENDIGPKGAAALASALARGNSTLVALGLGDNHIGVEGAGAFAAALRHNHSLHTLDVKNNGIPRRSSVRGLLQKMLEFNASDPGDESLVLGLQEELAGLVSSLPPAAAEAVVLQAEEALKTAMLCRRRGDRIGAAEAEGVFIRICTTGEPPVDPPEEKVAAARGGKGKVARKAKGGRPAGGAKEPTGDGSKPTEPNRSDGVNAEPMSSKVSNEDGSSASKADGARGDDEGRGDEPEEKEDDDEDQGDGTKEEPKEEEDVAEEQTKEEGEERNEVIEGSDAEESGEKTEDGNEKTAGNPAMEGPAAVSDEPSKDESDGDEDGKEKE